LCWAEEEPAWAEEEPDWAEEEPAWAEEEPAWAEEGLAQEARPRPLPLEAPLEKTPARSSLDWQQYVPDLAA
jgi:hypothetical protein